MKLCLTIVLLLDIILCFPQNSPPDVPGHGLNYNQASCNNENLLIDFLRVINGDNLCYGGYSVITAKDVIVNPEGSLLFNALETVYLQSPVHFHLGSLFKASIGGACDESELPDAFILGDHTSNPETEPFLKVYPNPGTGVLMLEPVDTKFFGDYEILVYSITGSLLHEISSFISKPLIIDLNQLERGIYLLRITIAMQTSITKIVIQ